MSTGGINRPDSSRVPQQASDSTQRGAASDPASSPPPDATAVSAEQLNGAGAELGANPSLDMQSLKEEASRRATELEASGYSSDQISAFLDGVRRGYQQLQGAAAQSRPELRYASTSGQANDVLPSSDAEPATPSSSSQATEVARQQGAALGDALFRQARDAGKPVDLNALAQKLQHAMAGNQRFSQEEIAQYVTAALTSYVTAGGLASGAAGAAATKKDGNPSASAAGDAKAGAQSGAAPVDNPNIDLASMTLAQAASFGAQEGIDLVKLSLLNGPFDLDGYVAKKVENLKANGTNADAANAFGSKAKEVYAAADQAFQADPAGTTARYLTEDFGKEIAQKAGVDDPQPLLNTRQTDRALVNEGRQLGSKAGADGTPLDPVGLADHARALVAKNTPPHSVAQFLSSYVKSYMAAGGKPPQGTTDAAAQAQAPKIPDVPGVPAAWMQDPASRDLSGEEYRSLVVGYQSLQKTDSAGAQALGDQLRAKNPAYADAVGAAAGLPAQPDALANIKYTYPVAARNFPDRDPLKDENKNARDVMFATGDTAKNLTKQQFSQTCIAFLAVLQNNPAEYTKALAQVPDPALRAALDSAVHRYDGGGKNRLAPNTRNRASDWFGNGQYSFYHDKNGWINGGYGNLPRSR